MDRARELRSRIKDSDQASSSEVSSIASKSEFQRQRRSKQLEATQKLLDGGFDLTLYNHDEQPVEGRSSGNNRTQSTESHSIISKTQLSQIQNNRYETPPPFADADEASKYTMPDEVTRHRSVREETPEGGGGSRGRGRGRRQRPSGTSNSLGELSRSSKSPPTLALVNKQQMLSKATEDSAEARAVKSYLLSRRVPDFKEGECEKLAILRQRLVARRRKNANEGEDEDDHVQRQKSKSSPTRQSIKSTHSSSRRDEEKEDDETKSFSLERLDPNDFTAKDFQKSSSKPKQASPPRIQTHNDNDHRYHGDGDEPRKMDDDEASVMDIQLIQCESCKRSFAPKIYEKHFDSNGQPKCASAMDKKRSVFNSAKNRIANNNNLNSDEQMAVLRVNKQVVKELKRGHKKKKKKKGSSKWREESRAFREAMQANRGI